MRKAKLARSGHVGRNDRLPDWEKDAEAGAASRRKGGRREGGA